jgi:hypothetical protein
LNIHPLANSENIHEIDRSLPHTFAEAVDVIKMQILEEFDREITQKQLYYHNRQHVDNVQRRSKIIFEAIIPYCQVSPDDLERMRSLLSLCAVAHDAIQIFMPQTKPHTSRNREPGVSETLTIEKLVNYIKDLNRQLQHDDVDRSVEFSSSDISIIYEAIGATICTYDPVEKAIYQPALDGGSKNLSLVPKILALADIGSLGMDGTSTYNREGSLLFLEENPDVIPIFSTQIIETLAIDRPELYENIRQRLLDRLDFQVNFAKSRIRRFSQEISGFSDEIIHVLTSQIFQHLNTQTIQEIESIVPSNNDRSLASLIIFFEFTKILESNSPNTY